MYLFDMLVIFSGALTIAKRIPKAYIAVSVDTPFKAARYGHGLLAVYWEGRNTSLLKSCIKNTS